jgi:hypothetical protein
MKSKNYRRIIKRYVYVDINIKQKKLYIKSKAFNFGGESGIRTHDRELPYANFQDWCLQPLDHLSNK